MHVRHSRFLAALIMGLAIVTACSPAAAPGPTGLPGSTSGASGASGTGGTLPGGSGPGASAPIGGPGTSAPPAIPPPSPPALSPLADGLLGTDGRWTVLVIGSDARAPLIGHRTDVMLIATVNPRTGEVVGVNLPRDTAQVPIAPDRTYADKINLLFQEFLNATGSEALAARMLADALAFTVDVEIDNFVFVGFTGFIRAIDAIGGVDVTLPTAIDDPTFLNPDGTMGVHLDAGLNHLDGQRALGFARTRKLDTDYQRSRRQQQLLAALIRQVGSAGLSALPSLLRVVEQELVTDIAPEETLAVFELLAAADVDGRKTIVLGPQKWASSPIPLTNVLRIDVVRDFFNHAFAPVT